MNMYDKHTIDSSMCGGMKADFSWAYEKRLHTTIDKVKSKVGSADSGLARTFESKNSNFPPPLFELLSHPCQR